MKNVIILGAGRTGSSFLAGLIAHKRFYINKKKIPSRGSYPDGDYENPDLIALNKKILKDSGYGFSKAMPEEAANIEAISQLAKYSSNHLYIDFLKKCEDKKPWLWKDPRLCYTIHFWDNLICKDDINFILITRDPYLVFRSHSKFRIKYSKADIIKNYYAQNASINKYLRNNRINALLMDYSELKHTDIIEKLNNYLKTSISIDDYYYIKRNNISKKEPELFFKLRYFAGLMKLKFGRSR